MKLKVISIILTLFIASSNIFASAAGNGHSHVASKAKVERNAKSGVFSYIKANKIDESWKNAKIMESKKINNEWVISFKNPNLETKNILIIYLTPYGKVKGANFK